MSCIERALVYMARGRSVAQTLFAHKCSPNFSVQVTNFDSIMRFPIYGLNTFDFYLIKEKLILSDKPLFVHIVCTKAKCTREYQYQTKAFHL